MRLQYYHIIQHFATDNIIHSIETSKKSNFYPKHMLENQHLVFWIKIFLLYLADRTIYTA